MRGRGHGKSKQNSPEVWEKVRAPRLLGARTPWVREAAALELRVIRQVWQAYTDVKTSLGKREFALALLTASQEA